MVIKRYFVNIIRIIFNFIFPPFCVYCRTIIETHSKVFCGFCTQLIQPIISKNLYINKKCEIKVFALGSYQQPLKSLILSKHRSDIVASKLIGRLLKEYLSSIIIDIDYIIPIPLHWTRFAHRGYNQADLIAQELSKSLQKPTIQLLKRRKKTNFQAFLTVEQRSENLSNAFIINKKALSIGFEGKKFLLVDDLMTTGATLQEAGRVLSILNPKLIEAVVLCRVV